jgi:hypothetical protein
MSMISCSTWERKECSASVGGVECDCHEVGAGASGKGSIG